ncbi:hypothetical protein PG984_006038 [Apiospora sp. TS-2023a]
MAYYHQQQQQQPFPATAHQNEWPVYPELMWGHELCPSPHRRPFAPFRNYRQPIPPPRWRKSAAERALEAREQAWRDRQIYLTNLPGRQSPSVVSESESESESGSDQETQEESEEEELSRHLESMATKTLLNTRNLILTGMDALAMLLNWFYHLAIVLAFVLFLASALQDPSQHVFKKLMLLFVDETEPEFHYVLVQNYRSWSVAQPC